MASIRSAPNSESERSASPLHENTSVDPDPSLVSEGEDNNSNASQNSFSDNDELVQMRGEGRYFGAEDDKDLGPVCRNCHERGHMAKECPTVVCEVCGKRDDHYTKQCPTTQRCSNCGQTGHLRSACSNRAKYIFCSSCDSRNHTSEHCPLIWRCYQKNDHSELVYPKSISCYNCAGSGHYGDDCPIPRKIELHFREESAFRGDNLARKFRKDYKSKQRSTKRSSKFSSRGNDSGSGGRHDRWRDSKPKSSSSLSGRIDKNFGRAKEKAKKFFRPGRY